jgi:hypothetical protein
LYINQIVRKTAAIFCILILAFNICGYRFAIALLQTKADKKLEARIDNSDYDEAQLMEITVPLSMPYQNRYTDFERHYGEITIDGKVYSYVKRKVAGDLLILKCIPNESKQHLKNTADKITKANSGQDQENNTGKKQSSSAVKIFSGEYDDKNLSVDMSIATDLLNRYNHHYVSALHNVLIATPFQPPRHQG